MTEKWGEIQRKLDLVRVIGVLLFVSTNLNNFEVFFDFSGHSFKFKQS